MLRFDLSWGRRGLSAFGFIFFEIFGEFRWGRDENLRSMEVESKGFELSFIRDMFVFRVR